MKNNAKSGDYVEVHLSKLIYEGVLLENLEDEKGIVLLKLDSGYNIGFNKRDVLEIKTIKEASEKKEESEIKRDSKKPNIAMIITGGTIASRLDPRKGGVSPLDSPEKLFKYYPSFFEKVNVSKVEIPFMKDSAEMDFKDWQKIARIAGKFLNDPDIKGIIVTHGTDSLHYTAAALSFFLRDLSKPVVLTYSQRSIDRASSDANLNLQCAAVVAISDIAEVMIVGHASTNDDFCYALRGCNVLKLNTSRRDTFRPINELPIAKVFPDKIEVISHFNRRFKGKIKIDVKFEEKVALVKFHPGQDPGILDYYIKKKYKGIVIEFLGLGQIAAKNSRKSWINKLKEAERKGILVFATPQTVYGRLDPYVYSTARELLKVGVIYLEEMLSTTALVKLGWILGHKEWARSKEKVKEMMLKNFCGEIGKKITWETFLY